MLTVVPRDVAPRRHYSRPAIALALARCGLLGQPAAAVRHAISSWPIVATPGWRTLRRWVAAVRAGGLFPSAHLPHDATPVEVAARAAQVALGHAPPSLEGTMLERVFAGAVAMA